MSEVKQRKAVYFATNELELKKWAEDQPGGFSAYIKRLIIEDQKAEQQRNVIHDAMDEFLHSPRLGNFIKENIQAALEGKIVNVPLEDQQEANSQISNDEADVIMGLIDL